MGALGPPLHEARRTGVRYGYRPLAYAKALPRVLGGFPMADTVRSVEYYYVTIPDTPGEVSEVLSAFKEGGVNLLAFLEFPLGGGQSRIDLVPEDPRH